MKATQSTPGSRQIRRRWRVSTLVRAGLLPAALFALATACGPPPPPQTADHPPPLDDTSTDAGAGAGGMQAPSSPKVKEGIDAIEAKDFEKAKAVLTEARSEAPKDPQAAFYLGVANEGLGDKDAAADLYRQALELDPKLTEAAVNLSALLLDQNKAAEALKVAQQGLQAAPKHPGLLMNLALATEATGDKPGTLKAYANAVAASPKNVALRYAYAENLAAAGQGDAAVEQLHHVVTDDPKLLAAMGNVYARLQKFSDCVGALDKAIKAQPVAGLHVLRGRCRHGMKDAAGEEADYQEAIKLDEKRAEPHFYLGQLYKDQGKKKEALAEFQKAALLGTDKKVGLAARKAIVALKAGK